jgi:hypothetical protein
MASSVRFDTHVELSKTQAAQSMQQSEPLNFKWIHELQSSSAQTQRLNTSVTIITPSDDDLGIQLADAESEVDEHVEEFLPSNEPNDVLTTE